MAGNMKFFYFGDDEAFFRALQGEFRKNTRLMLDFARFADTKEAQIQSFFLKVFTEKPACVFIDFSKSTQDYLHLARLLSRTNLEYQLVLVGLVDYLSPPEVLTESIATGVNYSYIKSAEIFDVVFDVTRLLAPSECSSHGFATAGMAEDWEVGIPCKVGYVHQSGIHIETNLNLKAGEKLRINHHWTEKRVVPSREVFVKSVSNSNLFYQYSLSADLEFAFADEFFPPEGMEEDKIQERSNEREGLIEYHKKQLVKWLDDNQSRSLEKAAKMLAVDREFHFYKDQSRTDKHLYTIRSIARFTDIGDELNKHRPQVIAFSIDKLSNTTEELSKLATVLKSRFPDLKPFLIVFNSSLESTALQGNLQYQNILAYPEEMDVTILFKMADILQKRLNLNQMHTEKRIFINKTQPASLIEIVKTIKVLKLSESDVVFQSEDPLTPGMNIHVRKPVPMYISVQPAKTSGKIPEYYGLIHSIGENEKKELRRYVNVVFFREHDAEREAQTEEFKKLNELKLHERLEKEANEKAAQEAELAKAEATDKATEDPKPDSEQ